MHENDEISVLNTNKIDFLSDKSPSKEKVLLDNIKSKHIRSEIISQL